MVDIESMALNEDQEKAVENVINLAKTFGFKVDFGKIQIPKKLGSIRIVIEGKTARDFLATVYNYIPFKTKEEKRDFLNKISAFDEVLRTELDQIRTGKQKFVAEKDEETQV